MFEKQFSFFILVQPTDMDILLTFELSQHKVDQKQLVQSLCKEMGEERLICCGMRSYKAPPATSAAYILPSLSSSSPQ